MATGGQFCPSRRGTQGEVKARCQQLCSELGKRKYTSYLASVLFRCISFILDFCQVTLGGSGVFLNGTMLLIQIGASC